MDKLLEFGRRALFVVRVLSGYEERRIRAYRLQLQKRIEQAQTRKAEMRRIPEQAILSEVRRMVEEMQSLNHKLEETVSLNDKLEETLSLNVKLEETEAAIEEYFKPIDKNAEIIMNMQLEKEEKKMKEMLKMMQENAMLQRAMAEKTAVGSSDASHHTQDGASSPPNQVQSKGP